MPFCKYIIQTDQNNVTFGKTEYKNELDGSANQRVVNTMRHLSQLIKIAEDIFGGIETECRSIHERTTKLNIKIQHCQAIVDNLNSKAVKIPRGSLSESQTTHLPFKSCDAKKIDKVSIFSSFPRPPGVDKLRDSAEGPSPPVVIPSGMVASEVEGFNGTISSSNTSTHIYCRPVKIKDASKSRISVVSGDLNGERKSMSSNAKVPSNVVAIDVSGQPFSRMASFRRSLIHVDFLIRRKRKKDKRRNTVAEGDVKDLKDALQKIVNEDCQFTLSNSICSYQRIIAESKNAYNTQARENQINDSIAAEKNNNAANVKLLKKHSCMIPAENKTLPDDKSKSNVSNSEGQSELKLNETENAPRHTSSKRVPKSHIPISTLSAAMNVAVEMRQRNGIRTDTTVLNGICNNSDNSLGSDTKLKDNRNSNFSSYNEDCSHDESWTSYKKRLQEKYRTLTNSRKGFCDNNMGKEEEVSSTTSSENIDPQDNTTMGTSTESDTFFISSDESDEDSSDAVYIQENYGSSTSLGTASAGSLNSLLSETGTEMTSSTGTLTSIGREHLLTPPPPPPPMILSATLNDKDIITKVPDSESFGIDTIFGKQKNNTKAANVDLKQVKEIKSPKLSKPLKSDFLDLHRNLTENSKNIFTSLVSLKSHAKDKCKNKYKDVGKQKLGKSSHQPAFDMYGSNSPRKEKQVPTFIKENISPVIQNEGKSNMKSFFAYDRPYQLSENDMTNKLKSDSKPDRNIPSSNDSNSSDATKTKGIQTVNIIPPKYEHQVTVKPVQRCKEVRNKIMHNKSCTERSYPQNRMYGNMSRESSWTAENHTYAPRVLRPNPPVTLQQERSKAARVVLDFNGRVIYSTNSLDRKHYNTGHNVHIYNTVQNASSDTHFNNMKLPDNSYHYPCQESSQHQIFQVSPVTGCSSNAAYPRENTVLYSPLPLHINYNIKQNRSESEPHTLNESYHPEQAYDSQLHTSSWQDCGSLKSENVDIFAPKRVDARPYSYAGHSPNTYLNSPLNIIVPDPNISGLPIQETKLTRYNVDLHSQQMEKMSMNSPDNSYNRYSDSFCLSPSQKNCGNILNKSPQSTMSTEDLFAVIHSCKKRMNIKTDSDISLASSSRSSSPSYLRPSLSKSTLAETGFLSPRSQVHFETTGDRRSWADFRPVESIFSERKSLASDRLGPTKPTSMHDFKMLLLQARTSSLISGPRKSAVEMLKVPLNQNNRKTIPSLPLNLSPRNSVSMSVQNSPTTELNFHNGHSTVPFKRGNRVRASLQPRYIMYPPIFEDCSEDSENCSDLISNKSSATVSSIENQSAKEGLEWNRENCKVLNDQATSCDSEIKFQSD